jgi:hypothetical protein
MQLFIRLSRGWKVLGFIPELSADDPCQQFRIFLRISTSKQLNRYKFGILDVQKSFILLSFQPERFITGKRTA